MRRAYHYQNALYPYTNYFMTKLSHEQVMEIPELSKTKNNMEMAAHFGVHVGTINRWKKRLKKAGYEVSTRRMQPII